MKSLRAKVLVALAWLGAACIAPSLAQTSSADSISLPSPQCSANPGNSGSSRMLQTGISRSDAMSRSELNNNGSQTQAASLSPPALTSLTPTPGLPSYLQGNAQNAQLGAAAGSYNLQGTANAQNSATFMQGNAQNGSYNLQSNAQNNALQSDLASDVRKVEYNVDWASWLSKVADRWFFILDQYERQSGTHYVTRQPALFRFTCYNNGQIANVMMKQSSGNDIYDRMQMVALMQSMPVPPFPAGTRRQTITLVQGWESHVRQAGESDYVPGSFGRGFPMEKVTQWVKVH
ncbi:MAG TPA: TonB C-terminal domain-containing protein [Oculatellaceae cyanobacterium]